MSDITIEIFIEHSSVRETVKVVLGLHTVCLCVHPNFYTYIGPLNPVIHGIRVASVIEFSVCSLYVTNFLILLQHNIRPPSWNFDMCATEFVARVNLRRYDTSR